MGDLNGCEHKTEIVYYPQKGHVCSWCNREMIVSSAQMHKDLLKPVSFLTSDDPRLADLERRVGGLEKNNKKENEDGHG